MNKKTIKTALYSITALLLVEIVIYGVFILPTKNNNEVFLKKISEIQKLIDKNAIMDFNQDDAETNALSAYVRSLDDKYCFYGDPEYFSQYLDNQEGNFTGIGVTVQPQQEVLETGLLIYKVMGNSPAENAGLKPMDTITEIDGTDLAGMTYSDAVKKVQGEADTSVKVTIKRNGEVLNLDIVRKHFLQREIDYSVINGNIGFIRIHEFNLNAAPEFEAALKDLISKGVKGFIFDLRNNPGGELNTVKSMVDLLVPEDDLVVLQYKNYETVERSTNNRLTDLPSVVLLNSNSASASELFSSALRDINASPLIGEKSFGKGIGQTSYTLSDGSGVKFTTFKYLTKSRTDYNGIGLVPDYEVIMSEEDNVRFYALDQTNDNQLQKAIEVIGGMTTD